MITRSVATDIDFQDTMSVSRRWKLEKSVELLACTIIERKKERRVSDEMKLKEA